MRGIDFKFIERKELLKKQISGAASMLGKAIIVMGSSTSTSRT
jgi:hypothetical protein